MLRSLYAVVFVVAAAACSGSKETATSPSPTPPPTGSTLTFSLSGTVTGGNMYTGGAAPTALAGATVSIVDGPNAGKSTTTDASGKYAFTTLQQAGFTVKVSAATYVTQSRSITLTSNLTLDYHYIHGTTQNVRPYRIQRMTAGESTLVTIAPTTRCV